MSVENKKWNAFSIKTRANEAAAQFPRTRTGPFYRDCIILPITQKFDAPYRYFST